MIAWEEVFPFWDSLSDLEQLEILDSIIIRDYSKGEGIKKRQGLYIINDGCVLVYLMHGSGRKKILLTANKLEVIMLTFEFLDASNDIFLELRADKDSEIYYVPEETWDKFQAENDVIRKYTLDLMSQHMSQLSSSLYEGMDNIGKQLALFLLRNIELQDDMYIVEASHESLADQFGTTREVITRNISHLKNLGLVETGRNRIRILDKEGMDEYISQQTD